MLALRRFASKAVPGQTGARPPVFTRPSSSPAPPSSGPAGEEVPDGDMADTITPRDVALSLIAAGFLGFAVFTSYKFHKADKEANSSSEKARTAKTADKTPQPLEAAGAPGVWRWGGNDQEIASRLRPVAVEELSGSSAPLKDAALGTDGSIVACTAKGAVFFARPGTGVAVVGGIRGAVAVGRLGADGRAVALLEDGSLRVWDPLAEVIRPVRLATPAGWVRAGARIKAISCGSAHILALGEDGNVYAWGDNSAGQLGVGDSVAREGATLTPVRGISARATAVGAGARHSVVVTAEGRALSFGSDDAMQLGLLPSHQWRPEGPGALEPTRVRLAEGVEVDGVACGDKFTILRGKDGRLISFGYGSFGQLGDGKLKHFGEIGAVRPMTAAAAVPGSPVVAEEVSCGADHCVMRTKEGEVWAWGANRQGQIGVGSRANASLPIPVTRAADKKIAIARAGGNFSLAIEQ